MIDKTELASARRRGAVIGAVSTCGALILLFVVVVSLFSIDRSGERPRTPAPSATATPSTAPRGPAKPLDPTMVMGDFLTGREGSENPADWITSDDYPQEALREGIEGRVVFELEVTAAGRPLHCTVTSSSGSPLLDQATCRAVMRSARFAPQRDEKGKPIPFRVSRSVRWQMPD